MRITKHPVVLAVVFLGAAGLAYWHWPRSTPIVNAHPAGNQIIALGDSLTQGIGATRGHDFVSALAQKIGRPILNGGVAGDTTADALARLKRDVLDRDPRIVIVFLGGNDVLRQIPVGQTFASLDQIVAQIQARGAMVVLVEVRPPTLAGSYGREFKRLARRRGAVLVPNVFRGIFLDPRMKSDQIHFNDAGYAVVAERIYAAIRPHL
jgi:lysophospholipase L1-like esterase